MKSLWAGSLGLSLGIWVGSAAGQETMRRPIAATPNYQAPAAPPYNGPSLGKPVPVATLGMPTPTTSGSGTTLLNQSKPPELLAVREPVRDGRVAPVSFQPIAATPGARTIRAQNDSPPALLGNLTGQDQVAQEAPGKLRRFSDNSFVKRVQGFFYGGQAPMYGGPGPIQGPIYGDQVPAEAMPFACDEGGGPQCMEGPGMGPCCSPAVPFHPWFGSKCGNCRVGGGVYVLRPHYDDGNVAFFQDVTTGSGSNITTTTKAYTFGNECESAPIVWLAWSNPCGLGVRVRWWRLDQSNNLDTNSGPLDDNTRVNIYSADGDIVGFLNNGSSRTLSFLASQELTIQVWDIEATQDLKFDRWALQIATGLRIARLDQSYAASLNSPSGDDSEFGYAFQTNLVNNSFRGVGPTIALEGKRHIGDCGLSLYALGRGSILFGTNRFSNLESQRNTSGSTFSENEQASTKTVMPIFELELGAEWAPCCPCCVQPFFRLGFVSQTWFGAGSPTTTSGNLGLVGLTATAGLLF